MIPGRAAAGVRSEDVSPASDDETQVTGTPLLSSTAILRPPALLAKLSSATVAEDAANAGVQVAQRAGVTADVSIGASFSVILSSGQLILCRYEGSFASTSRPEAAVRKSTFVYLLSNIAACHISSRGQLVAITRDGLCCGCILHDENCAYVGSDHFYPIDCDQSLSECLLAMCGEGGCDSLSIEMLGNSDDTYIVYNRRELVLIEGITSTAQEAEQTSLDSSTSADDRVLFFRPAASSAMGFPDVAEALSAVSWTFSMVPPNQKTGHARTSSTAGEADSKESAAASETNILIRFLVILSSIGECFFLPVILSPDDGNYQLMALDSSSRMSPRGGAEKGEGNNKNPLNDPPETGDFRDFQKGFDYWSSAISPGLEPNVQTSSGVSILGASGTCDGSIILWGCARHLSVAGSKQEVRRVCDGIEEVVFASKVLTSTVTSLTIIDHDYKRNSTAPEVTILSVWAADASGQVTELCLESGFEQQLLVRRRLNVPSASISSIAFQWNSAPDAGPGGNRHRLLCFCSDEMSLYEFCLFDSLIGFSRINENAWDLNARGNRSLVSCCALIPGTDLLVCGSTQPVDEVVVQDMRTSRTPVLCLALAPSVPNYAGSIGGRCTAIASFSKFETKLERNKSTHSLSLEESLQYTALIAVGQSQGQLIIYEVSTPDICRSFFGNALTDSERHQQELLIQDEQARTAAASASIPVTAATERKRKSVVSLAKNSRGGVSSRGSSSDKELVVDKAADLKAVKGSSTKAVDGVTGNRRGANSHSSKSIKNASNGQFDEGPRPAGVVEHLAANISGKPASDGLSDPPIKNIVVDRLSALDIIEEVGGEWSSGLRVSTSVDTLSDLQPVLATLRDGLSLSGVDRSLHDSQELVTAVASDSQVDRSQRLVLRNRLSLDVHCRLPITDIFFSSSGYFIAICFARRVIVVQSLRSGKAVRQFDLSSALTHISPVGAQTEQRVESITTTAAMMDVEETQDKLILALQSHSEIKVFDCIRGVFLPFQHNNLFSSSVVTDNRPSVPVAVQLWRDEGEMGETDMTRDKNESESLAGLVVLKHGVVAYVHPDMNVFRAIIERETNNFVSRDPVLSLYAKEFPVQSSIQFLVGVAWMHSIAVTKILRSETNLDARDHTSHSRRPSGVITHLFEVPPELRCSVVCLTALPQEPRSRSSRVLLVLADGSVFIATV